MARIAVITTSYPAYDGDPAGHFVEAEVRVLEREGHVVRVFRPSPGGAFGWPGAPARLRENPLRIFDAVGWMTGASVELRRYRPERVIAHWCVPSALLAIGMPLEIVSHGGDVRLLCQLPAQLRSTILARVLSTATEWRFVSEELKAALLAVVTAEEKHALERIAVVAASPVEVPDVRDDARAKRDAVGARRLYVCAGRLVASKRIDKVIDYVASSPSPKDGVLIVLGDGPEREKLERVARAWQGLDVRFLGKTSRRETLGWIGAADELVHASRVEGLSTVVREASLLGVPVTILS